MTEVEKLNERVSAARREVERRGETFYPGPSRIHLASFPPKERWDDWVELESRAWPRREERRYMLVPTTCFNCESACGLLAYIDRDTMQVRKFEGNPEHPGSRGRNCAKGPATLNQITDPDRILLPLKRVGARGEGKWKQVSWDEALNDIAGRVRAAISEKRHNEIMYHVGRPGEDGFTERVIASWGVDGHNSHTNVCSAGARAGYALWCGIDRPSPDHANADVILLVSAHLETGHYFNPHAQRITEARRRGAKLIVFDTRMSNTATHADHWLASYPGSEAAVLLAIANHLIQNDLYDREFVRRWWNWEEYMVKERPDEDATFESFETVLKGLYAEFTFEVAAQESGLEAAVIADVATVVAGAGTRLATHNWRSAGAGNEGGWQVARTLMLLNALTGSVATPGGTYPNAWNKFVPRPIHAPSPPQTWNELNWPRQYPLAMYELSFLLPHLMREQNGHLDVYFTRVYNPVWTNPDGFSWIEMLSDEAKVGLYVALTPTWNETAYFADYVLPMGHGSERHDIHSYETHDGQWLGFRQPVMRAARERLGEVVGDTRHVNPGEVWEENEFWIDLTWRIDPDGSLGIRWFAESKAQPGEKLTVDEYYGHIFDNSVPGLPEAAAAEGRTPLQYMRRYGAFELSDHVGPLYEDEVADDQLVDIGEDSFGRVYTSAPAPVPDNIVPTGAPDPDEEGRRPAGVRVDGIVRRGFPTPSGRLEFYSSTLAQWGWGQHALPTYIRSHVHPENLDDGQVPLISTFRLPVQIHTRSANAKWLDEIAHTNPLWIHTSHAARLGVRNGDLVRVETEIGYFVVKAWVTEGIHPGVVACSHHMGRWKLHDEGQRQLMATVTLDHEGSSWGMKRRSAAGPYESDDPDTRRIWWTDVGVHQNLTFPVHPDPVSGMHCWHQAVWVMPAKPGDRYGDIAVDTERSRRVHAEWLKKTRPADTHSPDGTRRPFWLVRPLKPSRDVYALPGRDPEDVPS
ncbi:MAG TPA: molybdopterin-dependent oxidoreductase [Acidobacteriota bacterium]|nr:molybdopterin-dependent oxidoreductase [Acidobacteriota bacterium]